MHISLRSATRLPEHMKRAQKCDLYKCGCCFCSKGDLNYNRGLTDITTHLSQIKESGIYGAFSSCSFCEIISLSEMATKIIFLFHLKKTVARYLVLIFDLIKGCFLGKV